MLIITVYIDFCAFCILYNTFPELILMDTMYHPQRLIIDGKSRHYSPFALNYILAYVLVCMPDATTNLGEFPFGMQKNGSFILIENVF